MVALAVLAEGGLAGLALLLGWLLGQRPWTFFWWDSQAFGMGILTSLPPLVLFYVLCRWPVGPLRRLHDVTVELVHSLFGRCNLAELALISILAGFAEEWMFRGVLQKTAEYWLQPLVGLVIVSIVFGLLHYVTLTYAVLATCIGLYLGWLALTFENLLLVMVNHAFYDFVALVYLLRRPLPLVNGVTEPPVPLAPPGQEA
jgi:uncharacterized protein